MERPLDSVLELADQDRSLYWKLVPVTFIPLEVIQVGDALFISGLVRI